MTAVLYTYRRCPYAMRARMALLLAGVPYQAQEVSLRDKPPALLALSPKGTVPVLLLPTGQVLEQSLDIMRGAFVSTQDVGGWWARAQSPGNQELMALCDADFKHHLDRYKYPQRFGDARDPEHHARLAREVLLEPLEAQLTAQAQLGGATACAACVERGVSCGEPSLVVTEVGDDRSEHHPVRGRRPAQLQRLEEAHVRRRRAR
eukprot:gene25935-47104_t